MSFAPLAETLVVDLTSSLAGPYCTQILAALGAEVVKVEHPQRGDETRQWGPPFWDGEGAIFLAANAGKRSLALDFHAPSGQQALLRLADRADVVVQSLRPGLAERVALATVGLCRSSRAPGRHGTAFPLIAPYEAFAARDGELMVLAANDRLFAALCSVLGQPELAADPRFFTTPDRVANRDQLVALLARLFAAETVAEW